MVIDPRKPKILVRSLAQKLKKSLERRLRRCRSRLDLVQEGSELQPVHRPKSLPFVDFAFSRAVKSPIGLTDGFIFYDAA